MPQAENEKESDLNMKKKEKVEWKYHETETTDYKSVLAEYI